MSKLKYKGYSIIFQEVPDETTLAINICGCPYHCRGCHSQYLWGNDGEEVDKKINTLLDKYSDFITCVCFMGGDWELEELKELVNKVNEYHLKTAIYSGSDKEQTLNLLKKIGFNYIKIGSYQEEFGGLNSKETNQRMYKKDGNKYIDITETFWRTTK